MLRSAPLAIAFSFLALALALGTTACGGQVLDNGGGSDASTLDGRDVDAHAHPKPDARPDGRSHGGMDAPSTGDAPDDAATDAGMDATATDGPFVMAAHPPLPLLVNGGAPGAGVLTAPQIVTVTFPGDPYAKDVEALGAGIASSSWWDSVRGGYCDGDGGPCIGDGPPGISVELTTPPASSYTDSEIKAFLKKQLDTGALPLPEPGALSQTIYVLYFPESTVVHYAGSSCSGFFGYHGAMSYTRPATPPPAEGGADGGADGGPVDAGPAKQIITYAVVDECTFPSPDGGVSFADTLAFTGETATHEMMETASDPVNGFSLDYNDPNSWGWGDILGVENGDLCDWYGPPPNYAYWPGENIDYDGTNTAQRIWSNPQVSAGGDPCLPIPPGVVFFEVAPQQQVVVLDVGGSVTIDGYAYSTAPVPGGWTVTVQDFTYSSKPYLDLSMKGASSTDAGPELVVHNGDIVKLTITLLADPGSTGSGEADGVFMSYTGPADAPTAAYEWPFIVITPKDAMRYGIDASVTMRRVEDFAHRSRRGSARLDRLRSSIRERSFP